MRKTFLLIFAVMVWNVQAFGNQSSLPSCGSVQEDQATKEAFTYKVDAMRKRIKGFDDFLLHNEQLDQQRQDGYRELKKENWDRELASIQARLAYVAARAQKEEAERQAQIKTYEEFARLRGQGGHEQECHRRSYIVQRDHFQKEMEKARTLPEEVEYGLKRYRPRLQTKPQEASPSNN